MAQQKGHLPVKGRIGNLSFYKSKDGYLVKDKGGIDKSRMASDPAFQRTRENGAEFGRAGKAGKLLRNAVKAVSQKSSDGRAVSRLTKKMMAVLKTDTVSRRGDRNVVDGNIELLQGFQFNINAVLDSTFFAPFTTAIDRATGTLSVELAGFVPEKMVTKPEGATHFQIISAGAEVDFAGNVYVASNSSSPELPWNNVATAPVSLENVVTADSAHPLFLLLGIEFSRR
ncbi:MAG TPA: hypothetical protein VFF57_02170 [Hanamia sp.]|nr:hypothetical protein [Hanamia sp.]